MNRFETFFIMDYVLDKDSNMKQYTIISALVFEQALYLEMMKHSMIHLFGAQPGHEEKGYMEDLLLFRVANRTNLKFKNLIFITRYGKFDYQICKSDDFDHEDDNSNFNYGVVTPQNLFLNMSYSSQITATKFKKAIGDDSCPFSICLWFW